MKQLALNLVPPPAPALDNFVTGRNVEVVSALEAIAAGRSPERFVFLWGETGSGRSHLLQAAISGLRARGVAARYVARASEVPAIDSNCSAVAVDDVGELDGAAQIAFFNLYNDLRERGGIVLAAGGAPPARLKLRPDLLTRLAWGLVYQLHALSDEEKADALKRHAAARAFDLPDGVAEYLLRHLRRDLPSLVALIDALDRYSLEAKRPITLPLLRELLQSDRATRRGPPARD
jgi:DnaA family protein